ncbi:urease accessory protein UreH domain-containing protein [Denitromonas halophila]|uniref:Sulfite exporter TauE/SafE family protein n=1 Tax=Denitromonas halophila TaxID=1629404 RepID=A0A557QGD3_9RHOO|nr:sulfite exporter TauE/SafE family protein [Denitromonas halophila]TVO51967.1 sulfite exporter TauE/SafE family protein [Denitromonas halophila]
MNPPELAALFAPDGQVGLLGALLLGLSMGLTACTITCLPFMGSWVLGRAGGRGEALRHTGAFLIGRMLAYAALGALAGQLGSVLVEILKSDLGNKAIGLASTFAGLWLLAPMLKAKTPAAASRPVVFHRKGTAPQRGCGTARSGAALPPLLLGAALSLTPCAPLGWLLGVSAMTGSATAGLSQGLAFGLGAAVTPLLLVVPLFGSLGQRLTDERDWLTFWLRLAAGGVLIFLGARRFFA